MFEAFGGGESTPSPPTPECPGCGQPDLAGDDFCHGCGHSFDHLGGTLQGDDDAGEEDGQECPVCASGSVTMLEYGRRQCDACGYTARDEG